MGKVKKILVGCGALVGGVVLAFVGLGAWMVHASYRANDAARAFCAALKPGLPLADVEAAAARHPAHPKFDQFDDAYEVRFAGALLHSAQCRVTVRDGKVDKVEVEILDD